MDNQSNNQSGVNVLFLGNNPAEMSDVYEQFHNYRFEDKKYHMEVSFDVKDSLKKLVKFDYDCILLSDTLNIKEIKRFLKVMRRKNRIKHLPITLLKTDNRFSVSNSGIYEFLLKSSLTPKRLSRAILRAMVSAKKYAQTRN
ncbi:hypothetical protein [Aureibacter tunicatorum]|uniref:DNA-binding response OmpR family regulator n=1 Tax=Aureibacter tunicatorum TaxID=866807 RepID=A0AAE3XLP4_9BACT|nr:hypothetical protein [Aureibacter tunicatorum]MDR6237244.1 DNA-binding response OmpR family regulator [Aureibacter tunicatorum]BDD06236.1 hypothetical protein AUTU_37190 [Aureibacter tunicatorum]